MSNDHVWWLGGELKLRIVRKAFVEQFAKYSQDKYPPLADRKLLREYAIRMGLLATDPRADEVNDPMVIPCFICETGVLQTWTALAQILMGAEAVDRTVVIVCERCCHKQIMDFVDGDGVMAVPSGQDEIVDEVLGRARARQAEMN